MFEYGSPNTVSLDCGLQSFAAGAPRRHWFGSLISRLTLVVLACACAENEDPPITQNAGAVQPAAVFGLEEWTHVFSEADTAYNFEPRSFGTRPAGPPSPVPFVTRIKGIQGASQTHL